MTYEEFTQVLTQIGLYDYGKPVKKYPRFVSFQKQDRFFPSDSVLERGAKAIRAYWNNKNLRKRVKK